MYYSTVKTFPTGLSVNLLPFIGLSTSTHSYWKVVLKQIMHSVGMSMIRERSIINFVERTDRFVAKAEALRNGVLYQPKSNEKVLSGWLELRKGFHSYITEDAVLVIFKLNVLLEVLNTGNVEYCLTNSNFADIIFIFRWWHTRSLCSH